MTVSSYISLHSSGELAQRRDRALAMLEDCHLCPRNCGVNRLEGETGICQTGRHALVASFNLHFGEEAPLVGERGSGTIFFAGCNLGCVFCQNYDISHDVSGSIAATPEQLAGVLRSLQDQGAHNINFVTPSHVAAQILEALPIAVDMGLHVPLVYNSSGYDTVATLKLLDGVVDIYMPDVKFWDEAVALKYSQAPDYPEVARQALQEMHRQTGDLELDEQGLAQGGLLVRHLVMPEESAGTREWMAFIAQKLSAATYINVMDQYRPAGESGRHPELQRGVSAQEYKQALQSAEEAGLERLDDRDARMSKQLWRLLQGGGGS